MITLCTLRNNLKRRLKKADKSRELLGNNEMGGYLISHPIPTYPPFSHYYSHCAFILSLLPHLPHPNLSIPPHSLVKTWLCTLGSDPPFEFVHSFTHGCLYHRDDWVSYVPLLGMMSICVTYDSNSGMYTSSVSIFPLSGGYMKFCPPGIDVAVFLPTGFPVRFTVSSPLFWDFSKTVFALKWGPMFSSVHLTLWDPCGLRYAVASSDIRVPM